MKNHNSKYYGNFEIDEDRLQSLAEDGVPEEIQAIARTNEDCGVIEAEVGGYVPDETVALDEVTDQSYVEQDAGKQHYNLCLKAFINTDTLRLLGDVVPLQISGATDIDSTNVTLQELMSSGMRNLWSAGVEGSYAVCHGTRPVNDLPARSANANASDSNLFKKTFPTLFPWEMGGMEGAQRVAVDLNEHVRWALRYHDRRFRIHTTFPFIVFGIQQKRQALTSAHVQMKRQTFERDARILNSLTQQDLQQAVDEEEHGQPISNPSMRLFRKHVYATGGRIQGTDYGRQQLRSQIWSTTIMRNPPSIWLTINPCDLHDPIAQIFVGQKIDLNRLEETVSPGKEDRARNVAEDPCGAAQFFHYLIDVIIKTLFGLQKSRFGNSQMKGIFGYVEAYFGAVEVQNRGSLHLHMILWLRDAPTAEEMEEKLHDAEFRRRIVDFIRSNIRSHLEELATTEAVESIPSQADIAWNVSPNPDAEGYEQRQSTLERDVVRAKQFHSCHPWRCLIPDGKGGTKCKRGAPFQTSTCDSVDEDRTWHSK